MADFTATAKDVHAKVINKDNDSFTVVAEDGVTTKNYTVTAVTSVTPAPTYKNLIASLIDIDHPETTLYNGDGKAYTTVEEAVANVKSLDFGSATAAQLMLKSGFNVTAVDYRNFTTTAGIDAASINVDIIGTGKIALANPGEYIAVEITVDAVPYYAVFQVV